MEDKNQMTTSQAKAMIQTIRIINREIRDADKLDKALQEIQKALGKGDTDSEQDNR